MPTEQEHIDLAVHNMQAAAWILKSEAFGDWAATITFYSAVHIAEAVFFAVARGKGFCHGHNHETRESSLKHNPSFENIYRNYRPLQSASTIARYLQDRTTTSTVLFDTYMPLPEVKKTLVCNHFLKLLNSAAKFLDAASATRLKESYMTHLHPLVSQAR